MSPIGFDGVSVRFGDVPALDQVTFEVHPRQVLAVIGGDGAGKSTLCRTLAGLTPVAAGRVRRPPRHRIGHLPAVSGVWPDLTVDENLAFVATAYRLGDQRFRRRRELLLEATDLTGATRRLASQLSGGMRRKLGLAMTLLPEPLLLVLDEPTTGIDPVSRFDLWRLISRAAGADTAVVMTTTYLDEAERASALLALDAGSVLAWGDLDKVREEAAGATFSSSYRLEHPYRWRRGSGWRYWSPTGETPPGVHPVEPDLNDILTAAALAREARLAW
jgi:ABC-2 type transport system ATP-binding protein